MWNFLISYYDKYYTIFKLYIAKKYLNIYVNPSE